MHNDVLLFVLFLEQKIGITISSDLLEEFSIALDVRHKAAADAEVTRTEICRENNLCIVKSCSEEGFPYCRGHDV